MLIGQEGKWHPRSFRAMDVTYEFLKNMTIHLPLFGVICHVITMNQISCCVYASNPFFVVHQCEQPYHQDENVPFFLYILMVGSYVSESYVHRTVLFRAMYFL
jgi:hypothetical protein